MKKKLVWRMASQPTAEDVVDLVDKEIITKEEGREILFNDKPEDAHKVKELEEEVKFLRDLCDTLASKSQGGWTTIVHEYRDYRPKFPTWYGTYGGVINTMSSGTKFGNQTITAGSLNVPNTMTAKGLGSSATSIKGLSSLNK